MANSSNNKQYDIFTFIGVAVSVAVLIYGAWYRPMKQMKAAQEAAPAATVEQAAPATSAATTAATTASDLSSAAVATPSTAKSESLPAPLDIKMPWVRRTGTTETLALKDDVKAIIAADGTGCLGVELPQYKVDIPRKGEESRNVSLGNADFPFMALVPPNADASLTAVVRQASDPDAKRFSLTRRSADGRFAVTETWSLDEKAPYEMKYDIEVENLTSSPLDLNGFRVEAGAMPPSVSRERKASRGESAGGASYGVTASRSETLSIRNIVKMKSDEAARLAATPVLWTAVHSKYFMLSLWMKEGLLGGVECAAVPTFPDASGTSLPEGRYRVRAALPHLSVPAGQKAAWHLCGYAGPKDFERLNSYHMGLEAVMDLDRFFFWRPAWMRFISRYLLKMLVAISGCFPKSLGYGLAVILLTIIVKLIFWPLSHKSTVSMRRMQALKPQLDAIKEKYKDDPTTMYRKQQELFKENNVSQLGGCLPMLLQIPVFFALFSTFRNAIELRHASFLWAYDLSMPDTLPFNLVPIRPFAILMAASMYLQQRMMPNPDPQQARMMSFMTIFFMFLFYGMPSALTLYLTVSYLLGILQTFLTNKMLPPVQPTASVSRNTTR